MNPDWPKAGCDAWPNAGFGPPIADGAPKAELPGCDGAPKAGFACPNVDVCPKAVPPSAEGLPKPPEPAFGCDGAPNAGAPNAGFCWPNADGWPNVVPLASGDGWPNAVLPPALSNPDLVPLGCEGAPKPFEALTDVEGGPKPPLEDSCVAPGLTT